MSTGDVITFFAAGDPKGQPRPRAFAMKIGNTFQTRVYDPHTAEGWKSQIAAAAREHLRAQPLSGPVELVLAFTFRRPRAHFYAGKRADMVRENAPVYHVAKPDTDNVAKAVMDALTQMGGVWGDDAQVARLIVTKTYGPCPGVNIEIRPIP